MGRRRLLVGLLLLLVGQRAATCRPAKDIVILTPTGDVTTFSFSVQFELKGSGLDASTVEATLNDETMMLTGGPVYTATISGGCVQEPLRASCLGQ